MQEVVTTQFPIYAIRTVKEFQGARVPWEVAGYAEDAHNAQSSGGAFDLSYWDAVRIDGPDAADYLGRMTTISFKASDERSVIHGDRAAHGAFLTGKAAVLVLGQFLKIDSGFLLLLSAPQGPGAAEHIEKFHFGENLTVAEVSGEWAVSALWNPAAAVRQALGISADRPAMSLGKGALFGLQYWQDDARAQLTWVLTPRSQAKAYWEWLHAQGVTLLGQHLFEYYRVKAGIPDFGNEVGPEDLVLKASLDYAIARNKGCYPGQEVVERIFTYGQVNRRLLRVQLSGELSRLSLPYPLCVADKQVGTVVSMVSEPGDPQRAVGLAYIHRLHWDRKEPFTESDGIRIQLVSPS